LLNLPVLLIYGPTDLVVQIPTAIAQQHERPEGTGYPVQRMQSEFSEMGQLLTLTDILSRIHYNLKGMGDNLRITLAYLRANSGVCNSACYQAACKLFSRTEFPKAEQLLVRAP